MDNVEIHYLECIKELELIDEKINFDNFSNQKQDKLYKSDFDLLLEKINNKEK